MSAGIDVQNLFGRRGTGKICKEFVCARQLGATSELAANVRKRILERIGIPKTDAVATLQTINRFRRK